MEARKLIDKVKKELNIEHDKELAELSGIKIGTLTQAIARNSFQFETLIPFLVSKGVDLNRIFGTASHESEFQEIADAVKHRCELYHDVGGQKMLNSFKEEINEVLERYDCIFDQMKVMIVDYLQKRDVDPQK